MIYLFYCDLLKKIEKIWPSHGITFM